MDASLLVFGLLVVFISCEGNPTGRSSNAGTHSRSHSSAYNGGGSSSHYPVDTGPIGQCAFSGSESQSSSSGFSGNHGTGGSLSGSQSQSVSQSSSSGFSGNHGTGGSFSGSQSQSGAGSFVNNNEGHIGLESGSPVVEGEHGNFESRGQSFGQALGNAIIETASQVQSAVNSGISHLESNIHNNVQNIANTVANGISSGLETLNAVQAASAATAANIQNNVQNIANAVAGTVASNLDTLNAVHGSSQATASSSAESGVGQAVINYVDNDRVGQSPYIAGNIDHTVSANGGIFSSINSGGASGSFQANTVTSVTQNGQTVINHQETTDRFGERPQTTSGTVVLDNNGQVIASEVRPGGSGNFVPRPETLPIINSGYTQGSLQSSSVSSSNHNGGVVVGQQVNSEGFVPQSPVLIGGNGNVVASSGPSNFATNGINTVSSVNSGFSEGNSGFAVDQTLPAVSGGGIMNAGVSNYAVINEQPAVVPTPQPSGNSFFDNLSSAFGSGGVVGNFHSSSVSSSTNQNGQTVVTHQETSDRFGESPHSSSGTVVVNNGVVSGVTCVDNQCVTHGN